MFPISITANYLFFSVSHALSSSESLGEVEPKPWSITAMLPVVLIFCRYEKS